MLGEHIQLEYDDEARSVHTVLRIIDRETGEEAQALFDNLTTVIYLMVEHGLKARQEFIGFEKTPDDAVLQKFEGGPVDGATVMINDWRNFASGGTEEALFIECYGDPSLVAIAEEVEA